MATRHVCSAVLTLAALAALGAPTVDAATITFTVAHTADVMDLAPGDGSCHVAGAPAGEQGCTLRAAVMEVNAFAQTHPFDDFVIRVRPGTYQLERDVTDVQDETLDEIGKWNDLDITAAKVRIEGISAAGGEPGPSSRPMVQSHRNDEGFRIFHIHEPSASTVDAGTPRSVEIRNIRISMAKAGVGAGVLCEDEGKLSLDKVAVTETTSTEEGAVTAVCEVQFVDTSITHNAGDGISVSSPGRPLFVDFDYPTDLPEPLEVHIERTSVSNNSKAGLKLTANYDRWRPIITADVRHTYYPIDAMLISSSFSYNDIGIVFSVVSSISANRISVLRNRIQLGVQLWTAPEEDEILQNYSPATFVFRNSLVANETEGGVALVSAPHSDYPEIVIASIGHNYLDEFQEAAANYAFTADPSDKLNLGVVQGFQIQDFGYSLGLVPPSGSVLVNGGDDSTCPGFDQGNRISVGACDIGAVESGAISTIPDPLPSLEIAPTELALTLSPTGQATAGQAVFASPVVTSEGDFEPTGAVAVDLGMQTSCTKALGSAASLCLLFTAGEPPGTKLVKSNYLGDRWNEPSHAETMYELASPRLFSDSYEDQPPTAALAEYRIMSGAAAQDAAPTPVMLQEIMPGQTMFPTAKFLNGAAIRWTQANQDGRYSVSTAQTKLAQLNGNTAATLEVVASVVDASYLGTPLIALDSGTLQAETEKTRSNLAIVVSGSRIEAHLNERVVKRWALERQRRQVLTLVVDTRAAADERVRLYVDGHLRQPTNSYAVDFDTTIDIGLPTRFVLGNRSTGLRSMRGSIYHAAIFDSALTSEQVKSRAERLMTNDG